MKKLIILSILLFIALIPPMAQSSGKSKQEIADSLAQVMTMGGDHLGYSSEILKFLEEKYDIRPSKPVRMYHSRFDRRRDDSDEVDFYSLLSGGLAIRESLQLDTITPSGEAERNVDIKTLTPPEIASHPYREMMKGRESKTTPLDRFVPAMFYSVHFTDTTRALEFFDYLNEVGGSLHGRFSMVPVDFDIKMKIMTQLALRENPDARKFYSSVIDEMSITGSDPFVIEGTDVTLIFKVKQSLLFDTTISMYRNDFRKKFSGKIKKIRIAGVEGELLTADRRKVNSLLLKLPGDIVIISNSVKAAEMVVLAYQKKIPVLADADDYRYMRSIYKAGDKNEDGFIYLSESFIRYLVSPDMRIREARRMAAAAKSGVFEKYIIYCYQLTGGFPGSLDDMIKTMELKPQSDGKNGFKETFSDMQVVKGSFGAVHEKYGRIGYLVPNIESEIGAVSEREATGYRDFVEEYSDYWKEYFDPIGIRFKFSEKGITVDTCILPLIENSIYTSLKEMFGGKSLNIYPDMKVKGDVLSVAVKADIVKLFTEFELFDSFVEKESYIGSLEGVFGEEIQIHMGDVSPLIDIDGSFFFREFSRDGWSERDMTIGLLLWSFFHPLRIAVPVKKQEQAERFINIMLSLQESRDIGIERYSFEHKNIRINAVKINYFGVASSRLYYCFVDGMLHFATTENYIRAVVNSDAKRGPAVQKNIAAVFRPSEMVNEKNSYRSGIIESALKTSGKNNGTIKLLSLLFPGTDQKKLPELAYENFGFRPVCPFGGVYSVNDKGYVVNSSYGSIYSPLIKNIDENSDISSSLKRFFSTEEIRLEFEFTPEGIKTTIRTK